MSRVKLIDPASGGRLEHADGQFLRCGGRQYPIRGGIPRFSGDTNYTDSFGLQWNKFPATQMDRNEAKLRFSEERFFTETAWTLESLAGQDVLEVGSGAGRFSRVVLQHTLAHLWSVDYSSAVDANLANNGSIAPDRFYLFQASIYDLPFPDDSFDKVFCLGVLQHTPDFEASVRALIGKAKAGGEIVVDFYPIKGFWTKIHAKYILRPISKRMSHDRLLKLIEGNAGRMIAASRLLDRCGLHVLTRFLPVPDIRATMPRTLDSDELREWVILDTFDMFSPEFDNPQPILKVARMFERAGADVTFAGMVDYGAGASAAVVRGRKRASR
jgi:SAM-dependent methyltransferase